jgi:hypothetical protein
MRKPESTKKRSAARVEKGIDRFHPILIACKRRYGVDEKNGENGFAPKAIERGEICPFQSRI